MVEYFCGFADFMIHYYFMILQCQALYLRCYTENFVTKSFAIAVQFMGIMKIFDHGNWSYMVCDKQKHLGYKKWYSQENQQYDYRDCYEIVAKTL